MKRLFIHSVAATLLLRFAAAGDGAPPHLNVESGVELSWPTTSGNTYQPQWALGPAGLWTALGGSVPGDGMTERLYDPAANGTRAYRVLEMVPGSDEIPVNGGFESGAGVSATHWSSAANQPPVRSSDAAHTGSFSMRSVLNNTTAAASEGTLAQSVAAAGGTVTGGRT